MWMGQRRSKQSSMWVAGSHVRGPGHRFYEALNTLLAKAKFDQHVEELCAPYYESDGTVGPPSIPPGTYFRMLLVGYFEGIDSGRGLEWRCSDSLSLKQFLGFEPHESVPDHSTLSRTADRLDTEVYEEVFALVLGIVRDHGLLKGKVVGVDSTYLQADASMKSIVRRETGDTYKEYLRRLALGEGIEEPNDEDLRRMDRKRKGKKTSNKEWESKTDPEARVARMKDGRTRLAYKAEHVMDMETGAILGADVYPADSADSATLESSLENARDHVDSLDDEDDNPPGSPSSDSSPDAPNPPTEVVADKGYHKAELLLELKEEGYRTYIPERRQKGRRRWTNKRGGLCAADAFHQNRARCRRPKGRGHLRKRGEVLERSFAHVCETGGQRRTRVRGRDKVARRYLLAVAGANLGLVMRTIYGFGTPRGLMAAQTGLTSRLLTLLGRIWSQTSRYMADIGSTVRIDGGAAHTLRLVPPGA